MNLDTTLIVKMESSWRHSYTFRINDENLEQNRVRNFVLDFTGTEGVYYAYIFSYDISRPSFPTINNIDVYTAAYETYSFSGGCFDIIVSQGTTCSCEGHGFGESCTCEQSGGTAATATTFQMIDVPCGGGGGPEIPSDPFTEVNIGGTSNGNSNTITYPGEDPSDDGPPIDIPAVNEFLDGLGTVFLLTPPVQPPSEEEEDPCKYLKSMSKEKPYLNTLAGKTDETREYGYYYNDNPGATEASLANGSQNVINLPVGGKIYGCSHTHPNPETTKWFPMFSIEDIAWVGFAYQKHTNTPQNPRPPIEKFFTTMTVKNGSNNDTFAIKVDDQFAFINSVNNYNSLSKDDKQTKENNLIKEYDKIDDYGGGYTHYAKALYKYLEDNNFTGFSIYKADDATLNNWTKLAYDSSDTSDPVKEEQCN